MTRNKSIIDTFFIAGYNQPDFDLIRTLVTEDYIDNSPAQARGVEACINILKLVQQIFSPISVETIALIEENDVRLLRRILVALRTRHHEEAQTITDYLRYERDFGFLLPDEQTEKQREGYLNRLLENEKWLARKYGCILLPEYRDTIFLNSKWPNPYTLYVRLVHPVPELEELGQIYWLPEDQKKNFRDFAEANHKAYTAYVKSLEPQEKSWLDKLLGR